MIGLINRLLISDFVQRQFGQNAIARFLGRLADSKTIPHWALKKIILGYIDHFDIDMTEYVFDIEKVENFNQFFTRKLRSDSRPLYEGVVSPADGFLTQYGKLIDGQLLQVKGKYFQLGALVSEAPVFTEGCYSIIYLSPANYHRFHAPFDLTLRKIHYIPGNLLATNTLSLTMENDVYCRNERIVLFGTCCRGDFYLIAVGATAVGRVSLSFSAVKTNRRFSQETIITEGLPLNIEKGDELGFFELGSTVILALGNHDARPLIFGSNSEVKMGEPLWC